MPNYGNSPFIRNRMKKFFLFAVIGLSLLSIAGCSGKKELKEMKGVVTFIWSIQDSLVTANVANGSDTLLFKLADARFVNGMCLNGDSVMINYIEGEGDTLRALVISVLPKPTQYIDLNSQDAMSDTLLTRQPESDGPVGAAE